MSYSKVAVLVTGQLRNASEHIENWLTTAFANCDPTFYFCIWDEIGNVDPNKMYQRSLRACEHNGKRHVEISSCGIYLKKNLDLDLEIIKIKKLLPEAKFKIVKYLPEYLYEVDGLKVTEDLKTDTHPFWQGSVPVAYINRLAIDWLDESHSNYDVFCRIQGETNFDETTNIDWGSLIEDKDLVLSSSDTISPKTQLSIKFFAATYTPFSKLMGVFHELIPEYKNYKKGTAWINQPIGERFLRKTLNKNGYKLHFSVKTKIKRQRCYPVNPILRPLISVKNNWELPITISVDSDIIDNLITYEQHNKLISN